MGSYKLTVNIYLGVCAHTFKPKEQSKNEKETETMAKKQKSNPQEQVPQPTVSTGQPRVAVSTKSGYTNPLGELNLVWDETYMSASMESILTGYDDPRIAVYFAPCTFHRFAVSADQFQSFHNVYMSLHPHSSPRIRILPAPDSAFPDAAGTIHPHGMPCRRVSHCIL